MPSELDTDRKRKARTSSPSLDALGNPRRIEGISRQGWLPTPGLRVASDRPTGRAHGWLKSAAGRATGSREDALRILAPFRLRRRGVETKLVLGNPTKSVDRTLLRNIANALSWLDRIKAGKTYEQIATENAIPTDRVRKAIRYAFLAPDIVRAIVEGRQPVGLTSSYLLHHPLPDDWEKQRVLVKTL